MFINFMIDSVCLICITKYTYAVIQLLYCAKDYTRSCNVMEDMMNMMNGDSCSKPYFGHVVIYFFTA